jgi:hypothetical protein
MKKGEVSNNIAVNFLIRRFDDTISNVSISMFNALASSEIPRLEIDKVFCTAHTRYRLTTKDAGCILSNFSTTAVWRISAQMKKFTRSMGTSPITISCTTASHETEPSSAHWTLFSMVYALRHFKIDDKILHAISNEVISTFA